MAFDNRQFLSRESRISSNRERGVSREDAELILRSVEERPTEQDFDDVYSADQIQQDLDELSLAEQNFFSTESENKTKSDAYEATVVHAAGKYGWFGAEAQIYRTCRFDDVKRGVDAVVEIYSETIFDGGDEEPHRLALAIDTTVDSRAQVVKQKMIRNLRRILGPEPLTGIKYFESVNNYRGELPDIVPVVIGTEAATANELMSLQAQLFKLKATLRENQKSKNMQETKALKQRVENEITKHPSQRAFTEEIIAQFNCYRRLLEEVIQKVPHHEKARQVLQKINELSDEFGRIYDDKRTIARPERDDIRDEIRRVSEEIKLEEIIKEYDLQKIRKPRP